MDTSDDIDFFYWSSHQNFLKPENGSVFYISAEGDLALRQRSVMQYPTMSKICFFAFPFASTSVTEVSR